MNTTDRITHFNHFTLETGDNQISPRSEVPDDIVESLSTHLSEMLAGKSEIPECFPYVARARRFGTALLVTVSDGEPVVAFVVAPEEGEDRDRAIKRLKKLSLVPSPEASIPSGPLLAVTMAEGVLHHMAVMSWAGDYERCVGWVWIEKMHTMRI